MLLYEMKLWLILVIIVFVSQSMLSKISFLELKNNHHSFPKIKLWTGLYLDICYVDFWNIIVFLWLNLSFFIMWLSESYQNILYYWICFVLKCFYSSFMQWESLGLLSVTGVLLQHVYMSSALDSVTCRKAWQEVST